MLDINLGRENSWLVATRLRSLGLHHVFATGYGDGIDYPAEHRLMSLVIETAHRERYAISWAFRSGKQFMFVMGTASPQAAFYDG